MKRSSAGWVRAGAASISHPAHPNQGFVWRPAARSSEQRSDTCKAGISPGKDHAALGACPSRQVMRRAGDRRLLHEGTGKAAAPPSATLRGGETGQHARMLLLFAANVQTSLVMIGGADCVFPATKRDGPCGSLPWCGDLARGPRGRAALRDARHRRSYAFRRTQRPSSLRPAPWADTLHARPSAPTTGLSEERARREVDRNL